MTTSRLILALGFAAILATSAAAQARREPEELGPDRWPITMAEVVGDLIARLSQEDKARLRVMTKGSLIQFHHGWGMGIRNYYGLRRGNKQLIQSVCGRPCDPDEASMKIIEAVWAETQR